MASRTLQVNITGDPSSFNRSMRGLDKRVDHSEGKLKKFGKVGASAFGGIGLAAGVAAGVGLKKAIDASLEAEKSQGRLRAQLKASGISYRDHAKDIDKAIAATSRLSGLDDEDLQDSFTNIVRVTGDVNKSLKLTGLAADFARAKHIDVAKAGEIVGKVAGGNIGILSRYGIVTKEGATASEALGKLQEKFSGQAEAYGKTTQGSLDRAGVAAENLGEKIGGKLSPLIAKGADALTQLFDPTTKAGHLVKQLGEAYVTYLGWVRDAIKGAIEWVKRFADRNHEDIQSVIQAFKNVGKFAKNVFEDVLVPIVKRLIPVFKRIFEGLVDIIRGAVRIVTGIINGDWAKAWDGLKDIVKGVVKIIGAILKGLWDVFKDAVKVIATKGPPLMLKIGAAAGKALIAGIVSGIKAAAGSDNPILKAVKGAVPGIGPLLAGIGDGIGKKAGAGYAGLLGGGAFGGDLHGASPALRPFANVASRFGLSVSAGRSDHSKYTASGNLSYHGSGEALDFSNGVTTPQEMGFARFMVSNFGSRLAELIYTPLGFSIKDGKRVSPIAASDHYDHVHVAMDLGRPGVGIGDGTGRRPRTGDGRGKARGDYDKYFQWVEDAARKGHIPPSILYGVWGAESNFSHGPGPVSPAGAVGPFQFMPATAAGMGVNPRNFRSAAFGAGRYLGQYRSRGIAGMLAAYNAGPAGNPNNAETRAYIPRVLAFAKRWNRQGGKSGGASAGGGGGTAIGQAGGMSIGGNLGIHSLAPTTGQASPGSMGIPGSGPSGEVDFSGLPSGSDYVDRDIALATLTPGNQDDIAAARNAVDFWQKALARARGTADPRDDTAAANGLKAALDALAALTTSVTDNTRALLDLKTQEAANYKMMYDASQTQYGALANAVAAAANGTIGGQAGLFFETPSFAGGLSRT